MQTRLVNWLLIVAILLTSTAPLYAQRQQQNIAKLKADAQKVVSIIKGDKAKMQTFCQISDLGDQIGEADEQKDRKKAEALAQKRMNWRNNWVPSTSRWSRRRRT